MSRTAEMTNAYSTVVGKLLKTSTYNTEQDVGAKR
jgi:hypothetical protein